MRKTKKFFLVFFICLFIQVHLANSSQTHENTSLVPAGEFLMGTEEGTKIERPVHKVYLGKGTRNPDKYKAIEGTQESNFPFDNSICA